MTTAIPSIACLGVIGRNNNPLHMSIFPSHDAATNTLRPIRTPLEFSLLLSSTIDVFELRARLPAAAAAAVDTTAGGVGVGVGGLLLHAVDDRLAAYGLETNTGVRMVCVVDMRGRRVDGTVLRSGGGGGKGMMMMGAGAAQSPTSAVVGPGAGLRDAELKPVFRAMQNAYVQLLQNPFHVPDEHSPLGGGGGGGRGIESRRFEEGMRRIGEAWTPGVTSL